MGRQVEGPLTLRLEPINNGSELRHEASMAVHHGWVRGTTTVVPMTKKVTKKRSFCAKMMGSMAKWWDPWCFYLNDGIHGVSSIQKIIQQNQVIVLGEWNNICISPAYKVMNCWILLEKPFLTQPLKLRTFCVPSRKRMVHCVPRLRFATNRVVGKKSQKYSYQMVGFSWWWIPW